MNNDIMTLGVFAHANAGKTTITEQLLVHTKVKKQTGRVDHGNTTTDNMKIEQSRGISVRASLVTIPLQNKTIQLIDTPGHVDFSAEVERAINVLDGAILVISGVEGIEPQTQVIWNMLKEKQVPTVIFINKMDRMGADYKRTLNEIHTKLDSRILPKIIVEKDDTSKDGLSYIEPSQEDVKEKLADIDSEIMEKYINDEAIDKDLIERKIRELSMKGELFCVYGGSALLDEGMKLLIDAIDQYLPTYKERKSDKFSGYVYTVKRENEVRELYVKTLAGQLENREEIPTKDGKTERIRTMSVIDGFTKKKVDCLESGQIGIITGLSAKCGEIIGKEIDEYKRVSFINPLFQTTIEAVDNSQKMVIIKALEIINDENPDLQAMFNKQTGQIVIKLMGALQAEVIDNILSERFGIKTKFSNPIIVHKETPIKTGYGEANYTRVSGVGFEVKPLPRGSGLKYQSKFSTDYLFPKYQKQVERLVKSYCQQGLFGWEVTDAEISLINGKCDNVGSDPADFNIAVPIALMRAFKDAGMKILEPKMYYTINSSKDNYKSILSLVSNYGVLYDSIVYDGMNVKFSGIAPLREIVDLPTSIMRLSGGHASMIQKPYGYTEYVGENIISKEYIDNDPRNEEEFIMNMGASFDNLDAKSRRR